MTIQDSEKRARDLTAYAYPTAVPLGADGRRCLLRWIVRSRDRLPDTRQLETLTRRLVADAEQRLADAYGSHYSAQELQGSSPSTVIVRIDDVHAIVEVEVPSHEYAIGDATAIGTWTILRGLDAAIPLEDIEGIPKRFWLLMNSAGRV